MKDTEMYKILGFIKVSSNRTKTMKSIGEDVKMPSEIANDIGIRTSQVSATLSDLKDKNLVVCVNEEVKKGRLYKCTQEGLEILKYID